MGDKKGHWEEKRNRVSKRPADGTEFFQVIFDTFYHSLDQKFCVFSTEADYFSPLRF